MLNRVYLIYMDILGFEKLAKKIAKETMKRPKDIRSDLVIRMKKKIEELKEAGLLLESQEISLDSWLLKISHIPEVIECIKGIITEIKIPLEIAIRVDIFEDDMKTEYTDEVMSLIKSLSAYKKRYKTEHEKSIDKTFIVFTKDVYEELRAIESIFSRTRELIGTKGELYYVDSIVDVEQENRHLGVVVNPLVFKHLAIRNVYGFKKNDNYWKFKEDAINFFMQNKGMSIGIHGIYGYHDVLIHSYEPFSGDPKTRLELRLSPFLNAENEFNSENFGWCEVERVIKYHGIPVQEETAHWSSNEINKYKRIFRDIATGEKIDDEIRKEMIDNAICIETQYDLSDITDEEKRHGKTEFLILVDIEKGTSASTHLPEDIFEDTILKRLLNEYGHNVRTIEKIKSSGTCFITADFILHVVGKLDDLNDVLIHCIHKYAKDYQERFQCKTQVVIPAEQISENRLPVLLEQPIGTSDENKIMYIIKNCRTKIDNVIAIPPSELTRPFAINTIDEYAMKQIIDIYEISDSLIYRYNYDRDKMLSIEMYMFLYGIAEALTKLNEDGGIEASKIFKEKRSQFINNIGEKVEYTLKRVLDKVKNKYELSDDDFNSLINLAIKLKLSKDGHFNCGIINIGEIAKGLRAIDGICSDEANINKAKKKAVKEKVQEFEEKITLLKVLYTEFTKWFAPGKTKEMYKQLGLRITAKNLDGFSPIRNLFSHAKGESEEEKILEIFNKLPDILQGVYQGVKYLEHINKRLEKVSTKAM